MKKQVQCGNVKIGGGAPVSVQTMTNTATADTEATVAQIARLHALGADLVRVSIPDEASAESFARITRASPVPLIADIHFDAVLALKAIEAGAAKIRLNPSNIGKKRLSEIVKAAKERGIPIRIGVNQGSVHGEITASGLASLALDTAKELEDMGFFDIVLAVKSSDVRRTVDAYRELADRSDYPLHVGLTESGPPAYGTIKSSVAIGSLLMDGIGDTIRVSLSAPPETEVIAGIRILRACGLRINFAEVIACPTCARTNIDVEKIASILEEKTANLDKKLKIAVMGCIVNGIGESKGADFGVCGGKTQSTIFRNKEILKTVPNEKILEELLLLAGMNDGN
jgi:(E)-4-hydroxy-3-methylbut-2-enyl-diphosphate synthase